MTAHQRITTHRLAPVILAASVLLLTACSDGGSSSGSSGTTVEALQAGDTVEVYANDELQQTTDGTRIRIRHVEETDQKFVTILSGTAELTRSSGDTPR